MRLVFLGSPEPVIAPLRALLASASALGHSVVGVVSQPAKRGGRGLNAIDPPVAAFAKGLGLPTLQPARASDPAFLAEFAALTPDVAITAAYGQILSDAFLQIPRRATINIHPSLLPKYRGATPVQAALLAGESTTGVTVLFTVRQLDAGPLIVQAPLDVLAEETAGELMDRAFASAGPLLLEALAKLQESTFKGTPQNEAAVTHCRKIDKQDGAIDWQRSSATIFNQFRAYQPWPGTFTYLGPARINIEHMQLADGAMSGFAPGEAQYDKRLRVLRVGTGSGTLCIGKVKPAGGKLMSSESFWNGLKDRSRVVFKGVSG